MLIENTLFGTVDKLQNAIDILKAFEPSDGYWVAFSGGKDSQCVYHLCEMANVKFESHYCITSVDPPELVRFIKKQYPSVSMDYPRDADGKVITMWNLIPKQVMPPTRRARYCCEKLKESSGQGRVTVTGVRWAESNRRKYLHGVVSINTKSKKLIDDAMQRSETARVNSQGGLILNDDNDENRRTVEQCYRTRKTLVNPIVDWEDEDVWQFLNEIAKVPHCELYDHGYKRLGCIGCPLSGTENMKEDFERYPKYKDAYIRAFERMIENHKDRITIIGGLTEREREREMHGRRTCDALVAMDDASGQDGFAPSARNTARCATDVMKWWLRETNGF